MKMYQIQIRKRNDKNGEWVPLYGGHETFRSLIDALKRYSLIRHNHICEGRTMWSMRICKII